MYDTVIIGAGPAGMTAALYAARANLKVALLEKGVPGGQMNNTADIENYPGFANISGPELSEKMFEPLEGLGVDYLFASVEKIEDAGFFKRILTDDGIIETKSVILATGAVHRLLGVPGEAEYNSRGVSYCAVCDGAFFRDEEIYVVGGGDSAVEEALFLTQFGKSVTIVHRRDQLRAQQVLQDRAFANEKISFIWDSVVKEIKGDDRKVQSLVLENLKTGQESQVAAGALFIYVGLDALSDFVAHLGVTDEDGWIQTDDHMATSIPGIFAAGDIRQKDFRQITTAVGEGAMAAQSVYHYLTGQ